jgi:predicted CopG family antitoxin
MTKTITISDESYELIKGQLKEEEKTDVSSLEDLVGKKLFIRTVTYHIVGKAEKIIGNILQLSKASWIADSGRFSTAIKEGFSSSAEIEPIGEWFVNLASVVDFGEWKHELPTKVQ